MLKEANSTGNNVYMHTSTKETEVVSRVFAAKSKYKLPFVRTYNNESGYIEWIPTPPDATFYVR